jgi:hypothetical protein
VATSPFNTGWADRKRHHRQQSFGGRRLHRHINEVAKGQAGGGPVTNVTLTNNRIRAGTWGALDLRSELGHVPVVSGNISATTGALLPGQHSGKAAPPHR